MIISASRRTDIPACYADWLFNRLEAGYVCVRNPMNPRQVSRISLLPDVVDGFVFWTKNPLPMLDRLPALENRPYYVQFTLTAYGADLEPGLPNKNDVLVPAFQALSRKIGSERVIWRYDPILLTPDHSIVWHVREFEALAKRLCGYTSKCVISFVDLYRHLNKVSRELGFLPLGLPEQFELAGRFAEIAGKYGLQLETCAETVDLSQFGIGHSHCIDGALFAQLIGEPLDLQKDPNQREACGCMASVDIGMYDSCGNGCVYCYGNHAAAAVRANRMAHDPASPLLYGVIGPADRVTDRVMKSCRRPQLSFFDQEEDRCFRRK